MIFIALLFVIALFVIAMSIEIHVDFSHFNLDEVTQHNVFRDVKPVYVKNYWKALPTIELSSSSVSVSKRIFIELPTVQESKKKHIKNVTKKNNYNVIVNREPAFYDEYDFINVKHEYVYDRDVFKKVGHRHGRTPRGKTLHDKRGYMAR